MDTRQFHLSDILTITTGILVSTRHMKGVYDILNYMTRDNLFTHQLPRAGREAKPYLLRQHPWLADIDHSTVNEYHWREWLDEQIKAHGEYHTVMPIPPDDHEVIDPLKELEDMVGDKPIVVIRP